MKIIGTFFLAVMLCAGMALVGCTARSAEVPLNMSEVKADLQAVSKARVLFAHQSVGRNILDGVRTLSAEVGVPVRVELITTVTPDSGPGIFHAFVGENGTPDGKIAAFTQLLDRPEHPAYDVAVLKFCYIDLGHEAHRRDGLAERYADALGTLRSKRPDVRLLPATVPLRTQPPAWKTTLKRLLGRDTSDSGDNLARNDYNQQLRARFPGTVFDIAGAESTLPDGSRSSVTVDGRTVYTLADAYTTDGGHLNAAGQRRVAAAFVHALAARLRGS